LEVAGTGPLAFSSCWRPRLWQGIGLENGLPAAHIAGMKKSWKIMVHVQGMDGKPGWKEYFIVSDTDKQEAMRSFRRARPDLLNYFGEVVGQATQEDLSSIMVVS
jgi:hypothetical protein